MEKLQINWDEFTFRCSSLGKIMVDAKSKSYKEQLKDALTSSNKKLDQYNNLTEKAIKTKVKLEGELDKLNDKIEYLKTVQDIPNLSETCKTHLCDIYVAAKYGRYEDILSKYMEKGLLLEEKAITQYCLLTKEYLTKNTLRKFNDWIEGEPDVEEEDTIDDTKTSWSIFTFTRTIAKPVNPIYRWQLDGYMWLFDKSKAKLIYVLLDTPEHLIANEEKKMSYEFVGTEEDWEEAKKEIRRNHTYGDIPLEEKVQVFELQRDEERIERIKARVEECRWFLKNITNLKNVKEDDTDTSIGGEEMAA